MQKKCDGEDKYIYKKKKLKLVFSIFCNFVICVAKKRVRWKRWVAQLGYLFGYLKSMNIEKQKPYIH